MNVNISVECEQCLHRNGVGKLWQDRGDGTHDFACFALVPRPGGMREFARFEQPEARDIFDENPLSGAWQRSLLFLRKTVEMLLKLDSDLGLVVSLSRQKDRRRGCLGAANAVGMVVGYLGGSLRFFKNVGK